MRRPLRAFGATVLTAALVATGCSRNTGTDGDTTDEAKVQTATLAKNSDGPAPEVSGAKKGGILTQLEQADFEHLDPAQNYVSVQQIVGQLLYRSLTAFRETGGGRLEVVGDLATNTGESTDGGRTWKFTLKEGVKYEDGRTITSQDVAYGVARSFAPELPNGPKYLQQWLTDSLEYNKTYQGPYNGGALTPPNVETPDARTIIFKFPKAQPDMPFAATLPTTVPVPKDKDTKVAYDNRPFSSGPYKVKLYNRGQRLELVRNDRWDPDTDPVRHQYVDGVTFVFGPTALQISERLIADAPADQATTTFSQVDPATVPRVEGTPAVKARLVEGVTQFNRYLYINTQRVTDVKVRRALNYAMDRQNFLKLYGANGAVPGTTILSPTTSGYNEFNAYDGGPTGDPEKARELLGGKRVKLVLGYPNTSRWQKISTFLKTSLGKAGFDVEPQAIDPDQVYTVLGKKDNPYDVSFGGWGSDWPSGNTIIPPVFDGRTITPEGNNNLSYYNSEETNKRIDSVMAEPDLSKAAREWGQLDEEIMTRDAPIVPLTYDKNYSLAGSKVGGLFLSDAYGSHSLLNVYIK